MGRLAPRGRGETEENNCLTSFCGRQPQDHQPFLTLNSSMKQGCGSVGNVADPWNFCTDPDADPDPRIRTSD